MSQLWSKNDVSTGALWQKPPVSPVSAHVPNASPLSPAEARVKNPGKRYAQIVKLKPEHYDEYKKVHAAVWPEVAKQIKNCNIIDCMSDFLFKTFLPCPEMFDWVSCGSCGRVHMRGERRIALTFVGLCVRPVDLLVWLYSDCSGAAVPAMHMHRVFTFPSYRDTC